MPVTKMHIVSTLNCSLVETDKSLSPCIAHIASSIQRVLLRTYTSNPTASSAKISTWIFSSQRGSKADPYSVIIVQLGKGSADVANYFLDSAKSKFGGCEKRELSEPGSKVRLIWKTSPAIRRAYCAAILWSGRRQLFTRLVYQECATIKACF